MAFPQFLSLNFQDNALSQVLQRIKLILEQVTGKTLLDGYLLESKALSTGVSNSITHKLGREPRGYIITQKSVDCRIWDDQLTNTDKDKFLKLRTSANVTVNIWIF